MNNTDRAAQGAAQFDAAEQKILAALDDVEHALERARAAVLARRTP